MLQTCLHLTNTQCSKNASNDGAQGNPQEVSGEST